MDEKRTDIFIMKLFSGERKKEREYVIVKRIKTHTCSRITDRLTDLVIAFRMPYGNGDLHQKKSTSFLNTDHLPY